MSWRASRRIGSIVAIVTAIAAGAPPAGLAQGTPGAGIDDPAIQAFAASLGSVVFAAGQMVIRARACGEGDERSGLDLRRRAIDRARECAAEDERVNDVADNMARAFETMLGNADQVFSTRGREVVCARYRSADLPFEIATALEMAIELSSEAGRGKVTEMPCPTR